MTIASLGMVVADTHYSSPSTPDVGTLPLRMSSLNWRVYGGYRTISDANAISGWQVVRALLSGPPLTARSACTLVFVFTNR